MDQIKGQKVANTPRSKPSFNKTSFPLHDRANTHLKMDRCQMTPMTHNFVNQKETIVNGDSQPASCWSNKPLRAVRFAHSILATARSKASNGFYPKHKLK